MSQSGISYKTPHTFLPGVVTISEGASTADTLNIERELIVLDSLSDSYEDSVAPKPSFTVDLFI